MHTNYQVLFSRFQDVYRKIQNTKEFIISEGQRINGTLLAFQSKFEHELKELDDRHQKQHDEFKEKTQNKFQEVDKECARLQNEIDLEKAERIKQADDNYNSINEKIAEVQKCVDTEVQDRKTDIRAANQKIDDIDFELTEKLKKESEERNNKIKEIENTFKESLERQRKYTDDFREKVSKLGLYHNLFFGKVCNLSRSPQKSTTLL